jgi:hypothetical protein
MSSNLAAVTMFASLIITDINNLIYTSNTGNDDVKFDATGKAGRMNIISTVTNNRHLRLSKEGRKGTNKNRNLSSRLGSLTLPPMCKVIVIVTLFGVIAVACLAIEIAIANFNPPMVLLAIQSRGG